MERDGGNVLLASIREGRADQCAICQSFPERDTLSLCLIFCDAYVHLEEAPNALSAVQGDC